MVVVVCPCKVCYGELRSTVARLFCDLFSVDALSTVVGELLQEHIWFPANPFAAPSITVAP